MSYVDILPMHSKGFVFGNLSGCGADTAAI